jgi:hypothetical protein
LGQANEAEVSFNIEERKVAEASHPNIARNEHSNRVVHLQTGIRPRNASGDGIACTASACQ